MTTPLYTDGHLGQVRRIIPDLVRSRELLFDLVRKEIRAKYRYAAIGIAWAVLEPLMMMALLTFVFMVALREAAFPEHGLEGGREAAACILCALVAWQFFSTAVASATRSLVNNANLISKVRFPREVVPLGSIGVAAFNIGIGTIVLLVVFVLMMGRLPGAGILWLPVIFGVELTLAIGLGLLLSSLHARFRDVGYMVDTVLIFGFYATPIFYSMDFVREALPRAFALYKLNPMVGLVFSYREALFNDAAPVLEFLAWPAVLAVVLLITGAITFRRSAPTIADHL